MVRGGGGTFAPGARPEGGVAGVRNTEAAPLAPTAVPEVPTDEGTVPRAARPAAVETTLRSDRSSAPDVTGGEGAFTNLCSRASYTIDDSRPNAAPGCIVGPLARNRTACSGASVRTILLVSISRGAFFTTVQSVPSAGTSLRPTTPPATGNTPCTRFTGGRPRRSNG